MWRRVRCDESKTGSIFETHVIAWSKGVLWKGKDGRTWNRNAWSDWSTTATGIDHLVLPELSTGARWSFHDWCFLHETKRSTTRSSSRGADNSRTHPDPDIQLPERWDDELRWFNVGLWMGMLLKRWRPQHYGFLKAFVKSRYFRAPVLQFMITCGRAVL